MNDSRYEAGFKAGFAKRKKEIKMVTVSLSNLLTTYRELGRQDVVGWMQSEAHTPDEYKAKLKEWGIYDK